MLSAIVEFARHEDPRKMAPLLGRQSMQAFSSASVSHVNCPSPPPPSPSPSPSPSTEDLNKQCAADASLRAAVEQAMYHMQSAVTDALKRHGTQPHSTFAIGEIVRHAVHHALTLVAPDTGGRGYGWGGGWEGQGVGLPWC